MTCYAYLRCSSEKQSLSNQRFEIEQFTLKNDIKVDKWVEETISTNKKLKDRKLSKLLGKLKKDDLVISSELTRLGRSLMEIMGILQTCLDKEVHIWTIKDNFRLGDDIQSKTLAFAFGISGEIEKKLISQRTKSSLARLKDAGVKLGRPTNKPNKLKLSGKEDEIRALIQNGIPKTKIAKLLKVERITLYRFLKKVEI